MANDTRSSRKIKDDDSNITKGRHISGKEASSKKEMTPSPSSTRKSKRLEKRMPTTPPVKRKSERVEKQRMPSPLRRSERGKKQHSSSSSEIKRTDRSSGSSDTKRKKEKREKSVRQLTLESRKVSKNERQDPRPVQVKRKRMDARSYRALIVQQTKKANATDPAEAMKRPDKLPQCESTSSGGSGSKQVEGGCPESRERSGEDLREEYQAVERSLEGSSSSLRNSEKKTVENYGEVELSNSNRKEACDSADGDGLQVSRSGDNPLPSPHVDLGKEITDDAQRVERGCSETEKLQTPELVDTEREEGEYSDIEKLQTPELVDAEREEGGCSEIEKLQTPELVDAEREEGECSEIEKLQTPELSTSKERSLGDIDLGGGDKVLPLKRKRNAVNMESDVSLMGSSKYICTSVADFISLSPPVCKRNHSHATCVTCLKRQRVAYDSMKMELCSCNPKLNQELCDTVTPKDRGEVQAIVTTGLAEKSNHDTQRKELPVDIQMDGDQNTCVICKLGGKILCCDGRGCKRSYHLSCLDPPLEDVPPGIWHCIWCVKKKIESGVHSVSEGIESIWDAREVEVTNVDGLQRQKQYLVKYKSLAHVHNQWVPESQLLLEAPLLVAKFNRKTQVTRWNPEWTMPHRLLKKRLLMPPRQHDEYHCRQAGDILVCHYEWLVKWRGLDYEHATWELENASFLNAREAQSLMTDYENRCKKAKSSKADKEMRRGPLIKLSKLPVGGSPGADINYLNSVNKLREYWHKGRNAVVFDDQERIMKVILFILSLQSNVCYPFLIISASSAISSWEAEFSRLAASVNVIVYNGNRDMRRSIRTLEFYSEGGCIMFQVLLSPPEAIVEDFEVLKCLRWEAIMVDDCQHSKISTHFEQIKMMAADLRLLFVNGQMKDTTVEYTNLLSLLETGCDANSSGGFRTSSGDNVGKLKERLSRHIAYECKSDSSKFVEYWVPVWISNLQLEQYCATILSNYLSLRSCSKNDIVGALREVLISTRKCCDHPYLVDPDLQKLIIKDLQLQDVEYLDVGIKASGKLQLLDKMLLEIKNRGLRVIILFQSIGGSGKDSIGDILDDYLRQRFGLDSYERVDGGGFVPSKKQAALNKFNKKEGGRFVFLLENRACLPSIKLSSVDTIIIFDSDWNPVNDLRALQRITIDSQFEKIKIFRLYSVCTVEEKGLILAKEDMINDSSLQNMNRSTIHMLLMWGASSLFNKLEKFHGATVPVSSENIPSEQSLMVDVVQEFMTILPQNGENMDTSNSSVILKVNGGSYIMNISLLGEKEIQSTFEELPNVFWTKLLEGRHPRWKYLSGSSQRNRKRVQYYDESPKKPEVEGGEAVKKRKKLYHRTDSASTKTRLGKVVCGSKGDSGTPAKTVSQSLPTSIACVNDTLHHPFTSPLLDNDISVEPEVHLVEFEERRKLRDAQKSLHILIKPEISKLCEILQLSEDVKGMVGKLLKYIMDNHHVNRESVTILQAFQISLCWIAASLLKHKIDHKESLALAKHHLNFGCEEEAVDYVYSKLSSLQEMFLEVTGSPLNPVSATKDTSKDFLHAGGSQSTTSCQQKVKLEVEERLLSLECCDKQVLSQQGQASEFRKAEKSITIKQIKKKCRKRMLNLLRKQQEEMQEFIRNCEEEKARLEKEHQVELAVVRSVHSHNPSRIDRLKILDDTFAKKLEEHKCQMNIRLENLKAMYSAARNKENERKACCLEEVKSWAPEQEQTTEQVRTHDGSSNVASVSVHLSKEQSRNVHSKPGGGVGLSRISETISSETAPCSGLIKTVTLPMRSTSVISHLDTRSSERVLVTGFEQHNRAASSSDSPKNFVSACPLSSEEQIPDRLILSTDGEVPFEVPETAPDEVVGHGPSNRENDGVDAMAFDRPNSPGVNQHDGGGSSINGGILSPVLLPVTSPLLQPAIVLAQEDPLPLNQALQDKCSHLASSTRMQDDDVPANEKQNTLQEVEVLILHPVDAVASDHSNHEAPVIQPVVQSNHESSVIERVVQLQVQQSTDLPQESSEKQNPPQVEFTPSHLGDAVPTDQSNHEAPVIEPVMHSQLSLSADLPSDGCDQPVAVASGSEHQCSNERHTSSQNQLGLPSDSEFASSQSNHEALIIEPAVQLEVSQCPDLPSSDHSLPDLPSASGIDHQSNSEGHISSQNAQTPTPLADNLAEVPNQALSQPLTRVQLNPQIDTPVGGFESRLSDTRTMPIVSDFNNRPIQTASTVASRMPLHMHPDPLQNELERIRKEMDQTMKIHEDTKLSLKSECEKEIEEIVAQIHRKYEAKLHDVEAAFQLRKNELDTNRNKVFMNKLLAEAFRSKCVELKASAAPGMQQDVPSSFTQHLVQLSSQESAQRPLLVAGLSSVTLPAPSVQTAAPSRPPIVGVPPSVGPPAANPPIAVPPRAHPVGGQSSVGLPAGSLWTAVPPVPVFRHSPALLSSIPTRPPHISPITPSTGNLQVGSEIRAPAPHLQPFRPSTSLSAATLSSLPRGMPSQLAPTNAPATTLSLHQLPARPQPPPIYESGPYNRAPQPESAGGLPVLPTSSLSALELLMDIDNRPGAKLPNSSNFGLVDLAEFGTPGSTQVNSAPVDVASDVVYLSDDD